MESRGVRWSRSLECFEMKCLQCNTYWPLDLEFWDIKTLQRCKACFIAHNRKMRKAYYAKNKAKEVDRRRTYYKTYRAYELKRQSEYDTSRRKESAA